MGRITGQNEQKTSEVNASKHLLEIFTKSFHDAVIYLQTHKKNFFMTHVVLFLKTQEIRLIIPEISNTKVHKCTSNHGGVVIHSVYTRDVLRVNTSALE